MSAKENAATVIDHTTPATPLEQLRAKRRDAELQAHLASLAYLTDFEAQEKKLRNKKIKSVEEALENGDTVALQAYVDAAQKAGNFNLDY